jgi:hypothetical protein
MFVFLVSHKNGIRSSCSSFEDLSESKLNGPTLTGASFASTSEVWTSTILEWLKLRDWKEWRQDHSQWHDLPTEFRKNLLIGQTDWQNGDVISHNFLFAN